MGTGAACAAAFVATPRAANMKSALSAALTRRTPRNEEMDVMLSLLLGGMDLE
jgi:hypothetical protein